MSQQIETDVDTMITSTTNYLHPPQPNNLGSISNSESELFYSRAPSSPNSDITYFQESIPSPHSHSHSSPYQPQYFNMQIPSRQLSINAENYRYETQKLIDDNPFPASQSKLEYPGAHISRDYQNHYSEYLPSWNQSTSTSTHTPTSTPKYEMHSAGFNKPETKEIFRRLIVVLVIVLLIIIIFN